LAKAGHVPVAVPYDAKVTAAIVALASSQAACRKVLAIGERPPLMHCAQKGVAPLAVAAAEAAETKRRRRNISRRGRVNTVFFCSKRQRSSAAMASAPAATLEKIDASFQSKTILGGS